MKCKWCGFESEDPEDFEDDFTRHRGYWCPWCDGFTYFSGKEEKQLNSLYLESSSAEQIKIYSKIKLNKQLSPLRYPGGKSKLIPLVAENMDPVKKKFVEPFCGGASVGLSLLKAGIIEKLLINDMDFGVYSLFKTICENPGALIEKINNYEPSRESFFHFRSTILNEYKDMEMIDAGFNFLIVNRLAYSGICKANPKGDLTERYNPKNLIKRIKWINSMASFIEVSNCDAYDIIQEEYWDDKVTLFIDPPYYKKGKQLYNKYFVEEQHEEIAVMLNELYRGYPGCADILITYDNEEFIKELYPYTKQRVIGRKFSIAN